MKNDASMYIVGAAVLAAAILLFGSLVSGFESVLSTEDETEENGSTTDETDSLPTRAVDTAGSFLGDTLGRLRGAVGGIL